MRNKKVRIEKRTTELNVRSTESIYTFVTREACFVSVSEVIPPRLHQVRGLELFPLASCETSDQLPPPRDIDLFRNHVIVLEKRNWMGYKNKYLSVHVKVYPSNLRLIYAFCIRQCNFLVGKWFKVRINKICVKHERLSFSSY